jgi:sec-independent protein translocase protein TatB
MLDIGWSEMLLIAVVAIVVIGPKDLPKALRTVGQWMGRARRVAREFKDSVDDMVRESELDELRRETEQMSRFAIEEPKPAGPPPAPRAEPEAAAPAQPAARAATDT